VQLVVLVGFDETVKQFDAGSQFSPALCVRRALGFVKDSHVRHTRDNVYAIADGRFDGVKIDDAMPTRYDPPPAPACSHNHRRLRRTRRRW
jgi:hypothetical protein